MDKSPIIEKIRKLLSLANSSNEHEAALAAAHAQRLLSEHNLGMADIDAAHRPDKADRIELEAAKALPKWVRHLSAAVCNAFDCQALHHPGTGRLTFIGVGADAQVAVYAFTYLDRTIRKLCKNYMSAHVSSAIPNRMRELKRQSYYLGAVSTVSLRLKEQKKVTPVTSSSLVPLKDALIKQAMGEVGPVRTMYSRRSFINEDAYTRGQFDGQRVGIHQGLSQESQSKHILPT